VLCDRYRLESRLASGGMGEVWRAQDLELNRPVAVKLLHPHLGDNPDLVDRFRREARAAARLSHPGIVAVYDSCSDGSREAIVMQLVEGPTLAEYLGHHRTLTSAQAVALGLSVSEALAVAHRGGLVHRDVKPANILFGPDRALVADFGIAKALDETDHTGTGTLLGSAAYLSPEQVTGKPVDARSDVFSLGVVLYECVTGSVPWRGDTPSSTALARLSEPCVDPGTRAPVDSALAGIIMACLSVDPGRRFADAGAVHDALAAWEPGSPAQPAAPVASGTLSDVPLPGNTLMETSIGATGTMAAGEAGGGANGDDHQVGAARNWWAALGVLIVVGVAVAVATALVLTALGP